MRAASPCFQTKFRFRRAAKAIATFFSVFSAILGRSGIARRSCSV
jgi:hypothetical protein